MDNVIQSHPSSLDSATLGANSRHPVRLDQALLVVISLLTLVGLIAIYAASSLKGAQQFGDEFYFFRKQLMIAVLGYGVIFAVRVMPFSWIQRATLPFLGLVIFLLALIFVPGAYSRINGAQRWLNVPIIGGQPSELTKLALVLFLARNLSRPRSNVDDFKRGILPNLAIFAVFAALLLKQKDLGTPVLLFLTTFSMLLTAGLNRKFVAIGGAMFAGGVGIAVAIEPYRIARSLTFLDPWATVKGSGFQIIQSFLAFQNGGLFGSGLGESKQKLFFLPEAHTDFILSVIGEELGLVGVLLILLLFFVFTWIGFRIARVQPDPYRKFLAFGLTCVITLQAAINMGVTMGLLPTKGIPLPFISSGTSSLIASLMIIAVLARLGRDASMMVAPGDKGGTDGETSTA